MASRVVRSGECLVAALLLSGPLAARAQDLGHKVLGTIGLDAGARPPAGLHLADRFAYYAAGRLNDRDGNALPDLELDLDAFANAFGVAYTFEPWGPSTSITIAAAVPIARVSLSTTTLESGVDRFGFGDVFVQPLGLGWRAAQVDVVASYAFYLPTARFGDRNSVSSGQVTHQLALGGQLAFDESRRWFLAALASYDLNGKKWGADLTRGDTVQLQGGVGLRPSKTVEIGVAGYAQWQVRDDRGADLPERLRGARDRAFGVGPELAVAIPPLRARLRIRCAWDLATRARPDGRILFVGLSFTAWQPKVPGEAFRRRRRARPRRRPARPDAAAPSRGGRASRARRGTSR